MMFFNLAVVHIVNYWYVMTVACSYVNPSKSNQHSACSVVLLWQRKIRVILSDILACSLWSTVFGELLYDNI